MDDAQRKSMVWKNVLNESFKCFKYIIILDHNFFFFGTHTLVKWALAFNDLLLP